MTKLKALALLALLATVAVAQGDYDDDYEALEDIAAQATPDDLAAFTLNVPHSASRITRGLAGIAWGLVKPMDFVYEALALVVLAAVLVLHFYTRRVNQKVATTWMKQSIQLWQNNFAHFGDEKNFSLIRDGPYDFIFYASGRLYVKKVYGYIKLVSRFDPIGYIFSNPYMATVHPNIVKHDTVVMDLHMADSLPNLFFAIIAKDQYANMKRKRYDVADFGQTAKLSATVPFPKDQFVVVTDAPELAHAILADRDIVETLWASCGLTPTGNGTPFTTPLLESLIITDQGKLADLPATIDELRAFPKMTHATLRIDQSVPGAAELNARLVKLVMDVVDWYGETAIGQEGLHKLKKVRTAAEERILKAQEEVRKKELKEIKTQAQKKKEDDLVGKMSAEEQRKFNERKQKQELKKKQKSGRIVM
ncbi:Coiled-coil domain-containing protein 47 [Podochytrium sp. JEL0797]|nr:Coiled-coil domain-containing protein 47 [Podochytrium sp. JEL0797]